MPERGEPNGLDGFESLEPKKKRQRLFDALVRRYLERTGKQFIEPEIEIDLGEALDAYLGDDPAEHFEHHDYREVFTSDNLDELLRELIGLK